MTDNQIEVHRLRSILARVFDYVMVEEGGFRQPYVPLANEAAALLGDGYEPPDTNGSWLTETELLAIARRAYLDSRYHNAGANDRIFRDDIPRLIEEVRRIRLVLAPLVLAAQYTDTDDEGFWQMVTAAKQATLLPAAAFTGKAT